MIKPQERQIKKKSSGIFIPTICRHKIENRTYRKPRGVDQIKKMKKTLSLEFLYLSFAITRLKIGLTEKKIEETTLKLHKTAYPALENPRGVPNVSKLMCHQNLSNTVCRLEIGLVEKKIKIDN